jgi:predicted unusual protein kinase regulating ubiquinone biosynthesis (AarF/ABC1/UbiB family)
VSINELADGDLKSLIHNRDFVRDTELTFNILIQTFISIATFQNVLGHIHRDPHYGNFLFQNNNDKGYYHYIFNGVSYYLKACKYNIIIYDYGLASPITEYKKTALPGLINSQCRMISYDYTNIIHSFFNSSAHKIKDYPHRHPEATHKATLAIHNNLENLLTEEYAKNKAKNGEKHYENYIFEYIIQEFLKYAPKGMFLTKRPLNVINSTPFYISSPQATKAAKSAKATKAAKA